jgi:hypothetical protein
VLFAPHAPLTSGSFARWSRKLDEVRICARCGREIGLAKREQITAARKGRIRDTNAKMKGKAIGILGGVATAQLAAMRKPQGEK